LGAITIRVAARELGLSTRALQKWIASGAPVVEPGSARNGALVDLDELRAWRISRALPTAQPRTATSGAVVDLAAIARALWRAHTKPPEGRSTQVWRTQRTPQAAAAAQILEAFEQIARELTGTVPEELPPEMHWVRTLVRDIASSACHPSETP